MVGLAGAMNYPAELCRAMLALARTPGLCRVPLLPARGRPRALRRGGSYVEGPQAVDCGRTLDVTTSHNPEPRLWFIVEARRPLLPVPGVAAGHLMRVKANRRVVPDLKGLPVTVEKLGRFRHRHGIRLRHWHPPS
jgi:hypothetical protein